MPQHTSTNHGFHHARTTPDPAINAAPLSTTKVFAKADRFSTPPRQARRLSVGLVIILPRAPISCNEMELPRGLKAASRRRAQPGLEVGVTNSLLERLRHFAGSLSALLCLDAERSAFTVARVLDPLSFKNMNYVR
jgi:hypothetical protein